MTLNRRILFTFAMFLLAAPGLLAQSGCFHSPEAPTDVLLVVGAAGMFYGSAAVRKWAGRRSKR